MMMNPISTEIGPESSGFFTPTALRMGLISFRPCCLIFIGLLILAVSTKVVSGQVPLQIYTDHLVNGFQDWSWGTRDVTNTTVVHSGSYSFSHGGGAYNALSFEHSDFDAR